MACWVSGSNGYLSRPLQEDIFLGLRMQGVVRVGVCLCWTVCGVDRWCGGYVYIWDGLCAGGGCAGLTTGKEPQEGVQP